MQPNSPPRTPGVLPRFLRPSYGILAWALLCSVLTTALTALTPQIILVTVDSVIGDQPLPAWLSWLGQWQVTPALLACGGAILLSAALSGLFAYWSRLSIAKGAEDFVKRLRDALFSHIQTLPFAWHTQNPTGEIIQRCTSDVEVIRNFITNQLTEVFRILFLIALYLGIMFAMDVPLSLLTAAFLPVIIGYSLLFYSRIAKRFLMADEAEGRLSTTVQENLTGVRVVRAFGRERFEIDRFDEKNNHFADLWIRLGRLMSTFWATGDLITGMQIISVVCFGVVRAVEGEISLGQFLAFVSYNASLAWPVRSLGRILSEMSKTGVSIQRLAYILDSQPEEEAPDALTPPMDRDIVFDSVSFSYEGQTKVLDQVSFTIPAGKTFAILGGTGSGKSTLTYLLDRLYDLPPENGRITIGGVDLQHIQRSYLRKHIGLVLQEPFLFSRTLEENIGISRQHPPLEQVRHAAATACVDEAILSFPQGYDTIVGERGVTLSGGQKQRVAIARTLMQQAPILVFDDSLSAVDSETDARIRQALRRETGDATVILISHRITTLMQADQILVLEDGKVAQLGSHQELIAQPGIYRQIYDIQMNSDDRSLLEDAAPKGGE